MRLAFDLTAADWTQDRTELQMRVNAGELAELAVHMGEQVLLFSGAASPQTKYEGTGIFTGLVLEDQAFVAVVNNFAGFVSPRSIRPRVSVIRDSWRGIHDGEFHMVIEQPNLAEAEGQKPFGFAEGMQAHFGVGPGPLPAAADLRAFEARVVASNNHSCAVTEADAGLRIVAAPIRPVGEGGMVSQDNCVAMDEEAAAAFTQFHMTLGSAYELILDLSKISPDLLERLNANGYARLPGTPDARPATAALDWHRQKFCELKGIG